MNEQKRICFRKSHLLTALVVLLTSTAALAWPSPQGTFDKTLTVTGPVNLEVLTHSGDVRVRAGATWLLRHFAGTRMEHYRAALVRWQEWTANNFLLNLESVVAEIYEQTQARGTPKV